MLSFSHNARAKSVFLILIISLLLIALSGRAQDTGGDVPPATEDVTPEVTPTEEITPEVTPTEDVTPEVTPTEEITPETTPTEEITPEPTQEITPVPTLEPTLEPTSEPTSEPTIQPTSEVTAEPTSEPTVEPTPEPLPLAFYDDFEDGLDPAWNASDSWLPIVTETGHAVQGGPIGDSLAYGPAFFNDVIVEFKMQLQSGAINLNVRGGFSGIYRVEVGSGGGIALYRGSVPVASGVIAPPAGWTTFRLSAIGGEIILYVDGVPVLTYSDPSPVGQGAVTLSTNSDPLVRIDDFKIFGVPLPALFMTPPTNLQYTVIIPDRVELTWQDGENETEYQIERFDPASGLWQQIGVTGPNVTSFTDHPLTCAAPFQYRVHGYHEVRDEYTDDAYSTVFSGPACATPVLVSPANGALTNDSTPDLTWTADALITGFEVELSTSATFDTMLPGYPALNVSGTTHTPAALPDGIYYWRVKASAPGQSEFSEVWSFTVDSTPLAAPIPTAPANLALVRTLPLNFAWSAVAGAVSYDVVFNGTVVATRALTSASPVFDVPQGASSWYVVARDAAGNVSSPSTSMALTFNRALTPAPNAIIVTPGVLDSANVAFTWSAAPTPATYNVQLDEASEGNFATPLPLTCSVSALTCTVPAVPQGAYVWRVLRDGEVPLSVASNAFFVSPAAPRAPHQVSPANNALLTPSEHIGGLVTLTWDWGAPPPPAGAPFTYDVEVSTSAAFNTVPVFTQTTAPDTQTATTSALEDGVYYWRVRAVNSFGVPGAWSAGFGFVIDSVAPPTATVLTPTGTIILQTARPTFTWTPIPTATSYVVEVNDVCGDGTPFYVSAPIFAPSHTIPVTAAALPQGAQTVCVKAFDASGNDSGYGPAKAFTIFLGTGPAQGAFIPSTLKPVFGWTATPGTVNWTLEYDTDTDFTSGATQIPVTGVLKALDTPLPEGTYYWRVVREGETFTSNVYRSFFVGAMSVGPDILEPAFNTLTNATPVHLAWSAATPPAGVTITDYEVMLSKNALFTTLIGTSHIIPAADPLQYDFFPAGPENHVRHFWRVRGLNNGVPVTQWSNSSFLLDTVTPIAPDIAGPTPNSIQTSARPLFFWTAVPTATSYIVEITDADGNSIVSGETVPFTSFIPSVNLPQTTLFFHVAATDGINVSPTDSVEFTVRLGTTPADGANVITSQPTFTWSGVPDATAYTLEIDDDPNFGDDDPSIIAPISLGGVTSYTLSATQALPTTGLYYWRLSHNGQNGAVPTQLGSHLFTYNMPLTKPTSPMVLNQFGVADDAINASEDNPIMLSWTAASPAPASYLVQVSTNNTFTGVLTTVIITTTFYTIPERALPDGVKYWRVRGRYGVDGTTLGPWSDTDTFTLDATAPDSPLTSIVPYITFSTARPTLTWTAVPTAVSYRLDVTNVTAGLPVLESLIVAGTSYTLPTTLPPFQQDSTYIWRVEAVDAAGNVSAGFLPHDFSVFLGTGPALGAFLNDPTPTFSWTGVTGVGAGEWMLQVDDEATMSTPYTVLLPSATLSYVLPDTDALTPGQHFWRVVRTGETAASIPPHSFWVLDDLAAATPMQLLPAPDVLINADELAAGIGFSWTIATGPGDPLVTYALQIANNAAFDLPLEVNTDSIDYTWLSLPADGSYWWRVRAVLNSDAGPWSTVRTFTVDQTPPGIAPLNLPVADAVITTTRTPTFSWGAATGTPQQYIFELSDSADFSTIRYTTAINAPTLTTTLPAAEALPNGLYYWRITPRDAAGNDSIDSDTRALTIAVP